MIKTKLVFFILLGVLFLGLGSFSLNQQLSFAGLFFAWLGFSLGFWRFSEKELILPWLLFSLLFSTLTQAKLVFSLLLLGLGFKLLVFFHRKMAKLTGWIQNFIGGSLLLLVSLIILILGQAFHLIDSWAMRPWFFSSLVFLGGFNLINFFFSPKKNEA